ncbi:3'-5' exonuclease [Lacihabitans sp. LS3-19]|uniref:3'-5' exonuclease n=1 Tax=Lacihabitans sp. LS3-19 TaxID=2487335 RepID=UPI0020CD82B9|nr:3'-5' exonuclease [Lacihabitans sp. LS3-19]MCP9766358.1 3'-5' exonuclease [Lacihabitans sp. LS3-19]
MSEPRLQLKNILFLDIETVSLTKDFDELPIRLQEHWKKKALRLKKDEEHKPEDVYFEKAAIYAEFGKVICIGVGGFFEQEDHSKFKAKTLVNTDEKQLLLDFKKLIEEHQAKDALILCAHNGREFDFPYLCRRMLINGIKLPNVLDITAKKPWEVQHIDTLEFWKFGDYKNYTSLDLLASVFDIPGSKSLMDGSEVNTNYYHQNNLQKITEYCREDVVVLAQLYLKLNGRDILDEGDIFRV